jgi:hypothetical protein
MKSRCSGRMRRENSSPYLGTIAGYIFGRKAAEAKGPKPPTGPDVREKAEDAAKYISP